MKVDREKQTIVIDEYLEEVSVEELQVIMSEKALSFSEDANDDSSLGTTSIPPAKVHCLFVQNGP